MVIFFLLVQRKIAFGLTAGAVKAMSAASSSGSPPAASSRASRAPVAPDWVRRRLAEGLGGVVLFAWNIESRGAARALTATLRSERDDVLVAIDEEGGDVTRLEAATGSSYPGQRARSASSTTSS